jgi:NAD(P)-dependent dehydrogenase (short-subunit alcohol dehydrogenase family)
MKFGVHEKEVRMSFLGLEGKTTIVTGGGPNIGRSIVLASERANFITGQTISVDGGYTMV